MTTKTLATASTLLLLAGLPLTARAQDSVGATPGQSDALSAYDLAVQQTRYVVDLTPISSSWNTPLFLGPVIKTSLDIDPLFANQIAASAAISADQLTNVPIASTPFARWTVAGQGVNPTRNTAPAGTVNITGYDRQFGVALSDVGAAATNIIGAIVGQDASALGRLYVTRTTAAVSRGSNGGTDTATLALGAIDASGFTYVRADDFNAANASKVFGENIARIDLGARDLGQRNRILGSSGTNFPVDGSSTTLLINNGTETVNTPSAIPDTGSTNPFAVILDFANKYRPDGAAGITTHLAAGVEAHRGNPSFHAVTTFGGVGTAASIARSVAGAGLVDSVNLFALNATGGVVATRTARLSTSITDAVSGATRNAAGNAEFKLYLSQVGFRGGNGQVGVGFDPLRSVAIAAATATEPTNGDFIAVARLSASPTWTIAAHIGKTILNGPSGTAIGTLVTTAPASMSSPAVDLLGNVYFVASYAPTGGGPNRTALIKAVNSLTGYRLERLIESGQVVAGQNSARNYTITKLTLADSDSIASGAFHSGQLLQPQVPGQNPSDPASPAAFGGAVVNATLTYDNGGTPEVYQAALFVGPRTPPPPPAPAPRPPPAPAMPTAMAAPTAPTSRSSSASSARASPPTPAPTSTATARSTAPTSRSCSATSAAAADPHPRPPEPPCEPDRADPVLPENPQSLPRGTGPLRSRVCLAPIFTLTDGDDPVKAASHPATG